jgi:uncharacterized membrane protein YfhO
VPCNGFLVLADLYHPGWRAYLDGKETRIYRANYAFRAVPITAGAHDVVFAYAPWTVVYGLPLAAITLIALLLCLGYWMIGTALRLNPGR